MDSDGIRSAVESDMNKLNHEVVLSEFKKIQKEYMKSVMEAMESLKKAKKILNKKRSQLRKKCSHRYTYVAETVTQKLPSMRFCKACHGVVD